MPQMLSALLEGAISLGKGNCQKANKSGENKANHGKISFFRKTLQCSRSGASCELCGVGAIAETLSSSANANVPEQLSKYSGTTVCRWCRGES